jgi:uncharacterized protein YkwD
MHLTVSPRARLLALPFLLLLAACSQTGTPAPAADTGTGLSTPASDLLSAQGTAAAMTLNVAQTVQINVQVNGQAPTPGQLVWTTSNAGVATTTQSGLVTARGAGSATVRAALANNPSAFIDFPLTVRSAATTPVPTPTPTPAPSGDFAARVLALTNAARAQGQTCGTTTFPAVGALTYNAALEQAAQGHAADMAVKNYFSHTSQDGRDFSARITATGYKWYTIGENIAAGQTTPETVVAGWLKSEGHCRNIMNGSFKELGVGYAANASSSYRTYWVQDFGAR